MNGIEVWTAQDLERMVPQTHQLFLEPDYSLGKTRLLSLQSAADDIADAGFQSGDNFSLMFAFNEAVTACPALGIDMFRPALEATGITSMALLQQTNFGLGRSMRHEPGYGGFNAYPYTPQSSEHRSMFTRDLILLSSPLGGGHNHELIVSGPLADKDMTRITFAVSASRKSGFPVKKVPIFVEGGNIVVSKNHVFTLLDTLRRNDTDAEATLPVIKEIRSKSGSVRFGKDIAILDHALGAEKQQRVFHLDMIVNIVQGRDGQEYVLLASVDKAKQIFEEYGFLSAEKINIGRWTDITGYPIFTKRGIEKTSATLTKSLIKFFPGHLRPGQQQIIQHKFVEFMVRFGALSHADFGYNLHQYFHPDVMATLHEYLQVIRRAFISVGIPEKNIIEVPSLLFPDGYHPYSQNPNDNRIRSKVDVPIYTPVNGIQMNVGSGESPSFFSVGGLKLLDDVITEDLATIGITHVPLPSAITLGYAYSGFRCVAVPWR